MLRLCTKSYRNDLPWLDLALKSVLHYCQEPIEWHIIVDDTDLSDLSRLVDSAMAWSGRTDVKIFHYGVNKDWADGDGMGGYQKQQWIKLNLHRRIDGFVHVWDSDLLAQRPFTHKDFTGDSGRPVYLFSHFNELMKHGGADNPAHEGRRALLKQIFHMEWCHFEYMRALPIPMFMEVLVHLERSDILSVSRDLLLRSDPNFSEFNVYGQFAHLLFPDAYEWKNAELGGSWSGGYVEGGSGSGGMDGKSIVTQMWSWSGVPDNVRDYINGLNK